MPPDGHDRACHRSAYNQRVTDSFWMRWDHKAPPGSPSPREEVFVFALVKDVRTMTGLLRRVDDARWEAVDLIDGALYMTMTLGSRELAEQHLAKHRALLEAAGWREAYTSRFIPIASVDHGSPARSRASVESHTTSRPPSRTIPIALRRRSHVASSNRVYPHRTIAVLPFAAVGPCGSNPIR
jgi:hypothetical protein